MSWEERKAMTFALLQLPALTVMPLLRKRIGYRTLSPGRLFLMTALLLVIGNPLRPDAFPIPLFTQEPSYFIPPDWQGSSADYLPDPYATPPAPSGAPMSPGWLGLFAIVMGLSAATQRSARWKDIRRGIAWHSYHRGISIFPFLRSDEDFVRRFVDPLLCVIFGFLVWNSFSKALGAWLIFSGLALRFVEYTIYQWQVEQNLNAMDSSIDGRTLGDMMQHFEQHPTARRFSTENAEVIHTTLSPDVEALIARRRASPKRDRGETTAHASGSPKSLTLRKRFYRLLWGRRLCDWWERRRDR